MDFAFEIEAIDVNHNNKKVAFAIEIFYRYVIKNWLIEKEEHRIDDI